MHDKSDQGESWAVEQSKKMKLATRRMRLTPNVGLCQHRRSQNREAKQKDN